MMPWVGSVLTVCAIPFVACSAYLIVLTLLSARTTPPEESAPRLRFLFLVPAHDEGLGIRATVDSLFAVDYPRALFRVLVVADNCTDDTAREAAAAGAEVLERVDPAHRGKGHALAFAFDRITAEGWADAVVVVDADTVASTNVLRAVGARMEAGASVVQARYGVRNPDASWRTRLMTIAFATFHDLRSQARERLGVSCGLRGNGMAFRAGLLAAVPFDAFSIVEDVEYGLRLAESGYRVHYAGEASVLGEMTAGERAARSQRRRWEGGRLQLARTFLPRLIRRAWRDRVALDLAIDLVVPPLSVLVFLVIVGASASSALATVDPAGATPALLWGGSALALAGYALRGWRLSGTGTRGLFGLLFAVPYVAWKLTLPLRGGRTPRAAWVRTTREGESP
jgi:1,2-diacylglycerol 3-beta-glucosyltransferase